MREVLTYARRGSRFGTRQQWAWEEYADRWVIPDESVDAPDFRIADWFDEDRPLIVEIGCGVGEATAALAAARPDHNVLGLEVWRPGVADCLYRAGEAGAKNLRMCSVDAVWFMEHVIEPGQLAELWTFFPDPWPKVRHQKRRLVSPAFARLVASRLAPGAAWRLASDWPDYIDQMREVLDAEPGLQGGEVPRWVDRPVTRFERRGIDEGHPPTDFCYTRVR